MTFKGYRVIDCDLHVFEPADLWLRYIEPRSTAIERRFATFSSASPTTRIRA